MVRIPQAPDTQTVLPVPPPLPGWARIDAPLADTGTDTGAAFQAGAALAALDARVRAGVPFAGVWRRRLALKAAATSARIARRGEDEAMCFSCATAAMIPSHERYAYIRVPACARGWPGRAYRSWEGIRSGWQPGVSTPR